MNTWIFWSLLSALFAAATAILSKMGVSGLDPNLAAAIRTTVVVLLAWLVAVSFGGTHEITTVSSRSFVFLCLSGLATGLSWLCYFRALALGPASKVAPLDKLSVVFVVLLAWPVLGERLGAMKLVGTALLVAGGVVLALAP